MKQTIYRKEALARLASPEQLDQLMPLTNPRGWIALGAAATLLLAAVLWMIFGTVSVKVEGTGALVRFGAVRPIVAPANGMVAELAVQPGDEVQPGQELFRLAPAGGDGLPQSLASPAAGRILEVAVRRGDAVEKGAVVATLEALDQPLEAVVYLSAADAYRVEEGMDVQIRTAAMSGQSSPMTGRVRSAARYPAMRSQMLRSLASEDLVDTLMRSGPRLEVVVELLDAKELKSLFSGTPCRAQITLYQHSPINILLPGLEDSSEL